MQQRIIVSNGRTFIVNVPSCEDGVWDENPTTLTLPVTANLLWHLDAASISGVTSGSTFLSWSMEPGSIGGKEGSTFGESAAAEPKYSPVDGPTGGPVVAFFGQSQLVSTRNTFDFTSQSQCFFVMKSIGPATPGIWNYGPESVVNGVLNYQIYPNDFATNQVYLGFAQTIRRVSNVVAPLSCSTWHIYNAAASGSYREERQNNLYIQTGSNGTASYIASGSQVVLGRSKAAAAMGEWLCAEHIMYNNRLSDADRTLVMNYLSQKYNIGI